MEAEGLSRSQRRLLFLGMATLVVLNLPLRWGELDAQPEGRPPEPVRERDYGDASMWITIPSIEVDAPIIELGLTPRGTLEVPTDFSEAGWWSGGTFPGKKGPAVIVGHVDSRAGPAVFYRLEELREGDEVLVWRRGKGTVTFLVEDSIQVAKARFPTDRVYGEVPFAGLRLVTCGGHFDRSTGHYVDNLIVFARRAPG